MIGRIIVFGRCRSDAGETGGRSFEWSIVGDGVDEVGETVEEAGAVATCDGAAGEWW